MTNFAAKWMPGGLIAKYGKNMEVLADDLLNTSSKLFSGTLLGLLQRNAARGGREGLHVRTGALLKSIRVEPLMGGRARGGVEIGMLSYGYTNNDGGGSGGGAVYVPGVGNRRKRREARPWIDRAIEEASVSYPVLVQRAVDSL